ncbi:helix-turn-helix domain-containing protein [Nocardia sp. NBC_01503]|uniref:helix-turn-helix domain-containing protein n=1 Tax=Nocardia sp. NBC_01503 TaxID=2975997 RepID=UPI002E7B082F|nr:helix-turn-helix domain-containing protein [Nocardia sp. NBC_01503]WTL32381.1 helix-turn-helix domain-containing protein [Nocardia sp. NBC_01503]
MNTWFRRGSEAEALVAEERLVLAATEMVHEALNARGVSKKELADRLGVRPTEISQRLSGRRNLTLRSLAQMMHALGYGIDLDSTEAVDMDAASERVGTRVVREVDNGVAPLTRRWILGFHVLVRTGGDRNRDLVKLRMQKVLEELRALDRIHEVTAEYPDNAAVLVRLSVEAEDALSASQLGVTALRTAIHTVGDGTPGWEKMLERMVQDLRINIDASDKFDESTSCS